MSYSFVDLTSDEDLRAQQTCLNLEEFDGWELVSVQEEKIDGRRWYKYWWKRERVFPPTQFGNLTDDETTSNE